MVAISVIKIREALNEISNPANLYFREPLINSAVRGEVLSLTKGRTMNVKHCKIIMVYGLPFDKLRVNGINQRFLYLFDLN